MVVPENGRLVCRREWFAWKKPMLNELMRELEVAHCIRIEKMHGFRN